jgi:hypothetical protein
MKNPLNPTKGSPLSSAVGIDYGRLRNLLAAQQWEAADRETKTVILQVAGREREGLLNRDAIAKFPSSDLRIIDRLWVKYSNGRFGFSVQKRIWQSFLDANPGQQIPHSREQVKPLGERLGWHVAGNWLYFRDLIFDISAPEGHLPSPSFAIPCSGRGEDEQAVWQQWCAAFCLGGVQCGVLFLGWWSLLERPDL